ncbi:unnamed protein product [Dovyalis caffra]|uniref:Uncharacterized protein n=1 Tax=Dovyalis caffra TaxID=77055 RepID=A0AAV1SRL5_9ROSI|nr:unnamed protein product [Dovyalis caffra]
MKMKLKLELEQNPSEGDPKRKWVSDVFTNIIFEEGLRGSVWITEESGGNLKGSLLESRKVHDLTTSITSYIVNSDNSSSLRLSTNYLETQALRPTSSIYPLSQSGEGTFYYGGRLGRTHDSTFHQRQIRFKGS